MAHNINDCKAVFVSWMWLVGILVLLCGGIGGLTMAYANKEAKQTRRIENNARDLQNVMRIVDVVQIRLIADMDTLKQEIRKQGLR